MNRNDWRLPSARGLRPRPTERANHLTVRALLVGLRDELADKLRQSLSKLVADHKIHTVGEKRLMRYHAGPKK